VHVKLSVNPSEVMVWDQDHKPIPMVQAMKLTVNQVAGGRAEAKLVLLKVRTKTPGVAYVLEDESPVVWSGIPVLSFVTTE
jgi:hypothetical protein